MADQRATSAKNGKLGSLNKQIVEIKKKIHLSEGQRKANFEECDVKKKENADRLSRLKKEVKELRTEFARAKNRDESVERAMQLSRKSSAFLKKRNLNEAMCAIDEDIVRYRKELDLIRYRIQKKRIKLATLLQEYETLLNSDTHGIIKRNREIPSKKQIIRIENQLLRMNVMQMEAEIVRKKYKSVASNLKKDSSFYASWLQELADEIKEQNNEIERLKTVKEEAVALRNATREELIKQETESIIVTQQQENLIQDYRKQVEERKLELENLERMIPPVNRHIIRNDAENDEENVTKNNPKNKVFELEEMFLKLRNATGVTKTTNVLDRFLNQQSTKDRLNQMKTNSEEQKMTLEKTRQQLTAEIEMRKFSESKDADQNAEKVEVLNWQISEQYQRIDNAKLKMKKTDDIIKEIKRSISNLCCKCKEMNEIIIFDEYANLDDPIELLKLLINGIKQIFGIYNELQKAIDMTDNVMSKKMEVISIETASNDEMVLEHDDRPLFPMFPEMTTPGGQHQPSEDEDEIPSRNILKRQAQLLVDAKSRRKCFNFKR